MYCILYCIAPSDSVGLLPDIEMNDTSSPVMNYIINHPSKQLWLNMQGQSDIALVLGRLIGLSTQAWQGPVCVPVYHLCMVFCIAHGTQALLVFKFASLFLEGLQPTNDPDLVMSFSHRLRQGAVNRNGAYIF